MEASYEERRPITLHPSPLVIEVPLSAPCPPFLLICHTLTHTHMSSSCSSVLPPSSPLHPLALQLLPLYLQIQMPFSIPLSHPSTHPPSSSSCSRSSIRATRCFRAIVVINVSRSFDCICSSNA